MGFPQEESVNNTNMKISEVKSIFFIVSSFSATLFQYIILEECNSQLIYLTMGFAHSILVASHSTQLHFHWSSRCAPKKWYCQLLDTHVLLHRYCRYIPAHQRNLNSHGKNTILAPFVHFVQFQCEPYQRPCCLLCNLRKHKLR